jgi:ABC-type Mn2+/Zn2+ transport system permease subunit
VGYVTGRAILSVIPLVGAGVFLAYVMTSEERYSGIAEDVQITVLYSLALSAAFNLTGVVLRRIIDAERIRRRSLVRPGRSET